MERVGIHIDLPATPQLTKRSLKEARDHLQQLLQEHEQLLESADFYASSIYRWLALELLSANRCFAC